MGNKTQKISKSKPHPPSFLSSQYYAALDLGTNNCRLLIAKPHKRKSFIVVDSFSKVVCLGEGMHASGRLSSAAMNRAIQALKSCQVKLKRRKIVAQRLVATHACRQADNADYFIRRVKKETGLKLEIISQHEEARLGAIGCSNLIERDSKAAVLFDIGGGSCEISLFDFTKGIKHDITKNVVAWISVPIGIITLVEQFKEDYNSRDSFFRMKDVFLKALEHFHEKNALNKFLDDPHFFLIGISGTVTTLGGLHLNLPRYNRNKVDGLWLRSEELDRVIEGMLNSDNIDREQNGCIGQERAQYIVAGCAILDAIRTLWPASRLRIADRGLREGILLELLSQKKAKYKNPSHCNK